MKVAREDLMDTSQYRESAGKCLLSTHDQSFFFFFPFDAHNHADDYSGTSGGVRKVHISALVTSPKD